MPKYYDINMYNTKIDTMLIWMILVYLFHITTRFFGLDTLVVNDILALFYYLGSIAVRLSRIYASETPR